MDNETGRMWPRSELRRVVSEKNVTSSAMRTFAVVLHVITTSADALSAAVLRLIDNSTSNVESLGFTKNSPHADFSLTTQALFSKYTSRQCTFSTLLGKGLAYWCSWWANMYCLAFCIYRIFCNETLNGSSICTYVWDYYACMINTCNSTI